MIPNNKKDGCANVATEPNSLFFEGVTYINSQQWALAYSTFIQISNTRKNKSVALLYNLSLCYFFAEEYSKAFDLLSKCEMQISIPNVEHLEVVLIPEKILTMEFEDLNYYNALFDNSISINQNLIKIRVKRLLVDIHLHLENWNEIIRLSESQELQQCKNVQTALKIAKLKTNTL